jgi:abortive infection bacteriophage resistance protein
MLSSELEKIEVSVRTQLVLIMGDYAGPFWFTDYDNFKSRTKHAALMSKLAEELRRSDDDEIMAF